MELYLRTEFRAVCGSALYSDRLCSSVRDEFRKFIGMKIPAREAEKYLINFFETAYGDDYDRAVCYLALADTEWHAGMLSEEIRDKALSILEKGTALSVWEEACMFSAKELESVTSAVFSDFDLFFNKGYCFEETENELAARLKKSKNDLLKMLAEIPDEKDVMFNIPDTPQKHKLSDLFVFGDKPKKYYEKRIIVLDKLKQKLLLEMPPPKKYPKPEIPFLCNHFVPGDIGLFREPNAGTYFAIQFLGQKKQNFFMSRSDIGISYENYIAIFDYFSESKPSKKDLKIAGLKPVNISEKDGKIFYEYVKELMYDEKSLSDFYIEKLHDDDYKSFIQMREVQFYLKSTARFGSFSVRINDIINILNE